MPLPPVETVNAILSELRVPELPYPVGKPSADQVTDWQPLLAACWAAQDDRRVSDVVRGTETTWSVQQVNAAYLADRIMDVFLRSSGLHPTLLQRLARLRFLLAWRLGGRSNPGFDPQLIQWLDSFADWRGWSDSGGRSSRALLDQLDELKLQVEACFDHGDLGPLAAFSLRWHEDAARRQQHSERLHQRLAETEQGAARQRRAEHTARAAVGRSLEGRSLPRAVSRFLLDHWQPLLRQIAWREGTLGENWRHAMRLLEWIVWTGDPELSDQNRERLYQVGEQLVDRIADVWQRVYSEAPGHELTAGLEAVVVDKLRGGSPETQRADRGRDRLDYDLRWLTPADVQPEILASVQGQWFVEGEGHDEQRRFLLALLEESGEVLWTNGYGVRMGVMPWEQFDASLKRGDIRPLPALTGFGAVAEDTLKALLKVVESQRLTRQRAAQAARDRAEKLRQDQEAARLEAEEQRRLAAELEASRLAEEKQRQEKAAAVLLAEDLRRRELKAIEQVDGLKLGGWIALTRQSGTDEAAEFRLKLAVRINASRKLVFVDRLGLNRTELQVSELVTEIVTGRARMLGGTAEFDETLSRVVGRIRVGR